MIATNALRLCGSLIAVLLISSYEARAEEPKPVRIELEADQARFLRGIGFAADNRTLFGAVCTSGKENRIVFWDVTNGQQVREFGMDGLALTSMRVIRDGKTVVTYTNDFSQVEDGNSFRFWDLETGQPQGRFGGSRPDIFDFDVSQDGQIVVGAASNGLIRIFDVSTRIEGSSQRLDMGARGGVTLALAPDGRTVAAAAGDRLYFWDRLGDKPPERIASERRVRALAFSPDGTILADGGLQTGDIILRDVRTREVLRTLTDVPEPPIGISALTFSLDGRLVAAAEGINGGRPVFGVELRDKAEPAAISSRRVFVWNVKTGELVHRFEKAKQQRPQNARLAISSDGRRLAVGWDGAGVIDIWSLNVDPVAKKE